MFYINQQKYRHIPYECNVLHGGRIPDVKNVKSGGCGICSSCMMVDFLTDKTLTIEECVQLSCDSLANHSPGTDLALLGPALAEKFNLNYKPSNSMEEVIEALQKGGKVIVRVKKGLFTSSGHFMLLVSYDGEDICFLDPGGNYQKFFLPENEGKVNASQYPFLYCKPELMHNETEIDYIKYYIFTRKK